MEFKIESKTNETSPLGLDPFLTCDPLINPAHAGL